MLLARTVRSEWIAALLLALPFHGSAQMLFDGSLGLPTSQGWTYIATGGTEASTNNAVLVDTSAHNAYQAGYSDLAGELNRTNGFTVLFTSQLLSETHANTNRAGFSVIVLADDHRGLELAFWTNGIFAQSDSPLFTQAEATNYPTTVFVNYALTFHPTNYVLTANGTPILSGPVRDYSAFSGFPDPYSSANFLFFGDDTTSAGGAVLLQMVALVTAPKLVASPDRLITWTGVPNQAYTVQASSNLSVWTATATVSSTSSQFSYTNPASATPSFYRVRYP